MKTANPVVGQFPERLTTAQRIELAGQWIAVELYSPKTLPLRKIAAIGASVADCARQIQQAGRNPAEFEYQMLTPPF